jgi:hypothetical protein
MLEPEREREWVNGIRIEARMLTLEAENAKLSEEVGISQNKAREYE